MSNRFFYGLKNSLCITITFWIITGSTVFALSHSLGKKDKENIETQVESTVVWFEWNGNSLSVRTIDNHLSAAGDVLRSEGNKMYTFNPDTVDIDETNLSYTNISSDIEVLITKIISEINK